MLSAQDGNALKEQITAAESRALELSAREQQVRQQEGIEVPRARCARRPHPCTSLVSTHRACRAARRHTISLYANISSIRWDYSSPQVKGFITSAGGAGIKAFELVRLARRPPPRFARPPGRLSSQDKAQHSACAIANYLWELMDS